MRTALALGILLFSLIQVGPGLARGADLEIWTRSSSKIGLERIHDLSGDAGHFNLLHWEQSSRVQFAEFGSNSRVQLNFRLEFEPEQHDDWFAENLERLTLAYFYNWSQTEIGIGWQELNWGEALSLPILDITNPRQLQHPRGFYDSSAKITNPMLTVNWNHFPWQLTSFLSFWPNNPRLPDEVGDFAVVQPKRAEPFHKYEAGLRLGVMLNDLDLKLMAIRHEARIPSFALAPFSEKGDLVLSQDGVNTFGLSTSWASEELVLRGDILHSLDHPAPGIAHLREYRDLTQAIVGLDYSPRSHLVLGVEAHFDDWGKLPYHLAEGPWAQSPDQSGQIWWYGTNSRIEALNNKLETQILFLQTMQRNDQLLRIRNLAHVAQDKSLSLEYQSIRFDSSSPKYVLSEQQRLLIGMELSL